MKNICIHHSQHNGEGNGAQQEATHFWGHYESLHSSRLFDFQVSIALHDTTIGVSACSLRCTWIFVWVFQEFPTWMRCWVLWALSTAVVVLCELGMLTHPRLHIYTFPDTFKCTLFPTGTWCLYCVINQTCQIDFTAPSEKQKGSQPATLKRWKKTKRSVIVVKPNTWTYGIKNEET